MSGPCSAGFTSGHWGAESPASVAAESEGFRLPVSGGQSLMDSGCRFLVAGVWMVTLMILKTVSMTFGRRGWMGAIRKQTGTQQLGCTARSLR